MNREEIEAKVIETTQRFVSPAGERMSVSLDDSFREDLGGDSLDMVQVVMELEHQFDITITDEECDGLTVAGSKVRDIADLVERKLNG